MCMSVFYLIRVMFLNNTFLWEYSSYQFSLPLLKFERGVLKHSVSSSIFVVNFMRAPLSIHCDEILLYWKYIYYVSQKVSFPKVKPTAKTHSTK